MRPMTVPGYRLWLLVLLAAAGGVHAHADTPPTPSESLAALRLADPELKIELVAADPDVESPVAIAWDEQGRLYVAEMRDYPAAPTAGRIKRLEDRDHDGRYEHVTIFADRLPYPNGVLPWNGGLIVTAAPDLLYFEDRDNDGRAESRRVLLTGFGEGNQQLRVNSPTWGLDNRITLANGRSGGAVRRPEDPPSRAQPIPRQDIRFDPRSGLFEPIAGFSQFGLPRDDHGNRFPSWNTVPLRHVVLEELGGAVPNRTVAEILDLSDGGRIYSVAPSQRRFNKETVAYFNASCGPLIYRGESLGGRYRGDAFVCEPLSSVVHHRKLEPTGATFRATRVEQGREFLASTHLWFRPVNLANGPDGALYVVDFCRAWVEHPAFVPEGQRTSVDFREGFERGRIWRISRRDEARPRAPLGLPLEADPSALVSSLSHANGWIRDTAHRLLIERHDPRSVAPLRELVARSSSPLARIHALWILDGLEALDAPTLQAAVADSDAHVREQAVRVVQRRKSPAVFLEPLLRLADDDALRVRLQIALVLSGSDQDAARSALARIAARDADSTWTLEAIIGSPRFDPAAFLASIEATPRWFEGPTEAQSDFLRRIAGRLGQNADRPKLERLAKLVERYPASPGSLALLQGLAESSTGRRWYGRQTLTESDAQLRPLFQGAVASALLAATSRVQPASVRARALAVVIGVRDPAAAQVTLDLLASDQPAEVQTVAARGVAVLADLKLAGAVLDRWDGLTIATRRILVGALTSSPALASRLIEAVERGGVSPAEVDPATRDALMRLNDPDLRSRLTALFKSSPEADRAAVVARHEPVLTLAGDVERGRGLFAKHCQTCHSRGGVGNKVGPDLLSVVGKPAADLLVAVLDPSREAAPDGQAFLVATVTGQTLTGLLIEENAESIRLRRAEGLEDTIPRDQIEAVRPTGRSLMPDGLEQVLPAQDLADVIAFLRFPPPESSPPPHR
ncbi:MAG: PVC-type heme-binding CxxCH protein [Isosphaeraceae bacterium]